MNNINYYNQRLETVGKNCNQNYTFSILAGSVFSNLLGKKKRRVMHIFIDPRLLRCGFLLIIFLWNFSEQSSRPDAGNDVGTCKWPGGNKDFV